MPLVIVLDTSQRILLDSSPLSFHSMNSLFDFFNKALLALCEPFFSFTQSSLTGSRARLWPGVKADTPTFSAAACQVKLFSKKSEFQGLKISMPVLRGWFQLSIYLPFWCWRLLRQLCWWTWTRHCPLPGLLPRRSFLVYKERSLLTWPNRWLALSLCQLVSPVASSIWGRWDPRWTCSGMGVHLIHHPPKHLYLKSA